jgi:hypothetical protein
MRQAVSAEVHKLVLYQKHGLNTKYYGKKRLHAGQKITILVGCWNLRQKAYIYKELTQQSEPSSRSSHAQGSRLQKLHTLVCMVVVWHAEIKTLT